jgi:hypothetical protein
VLQTAAEDASLSPPHQGPRWPNGTFGSTPKVRKKHQKIEHVSFSPNTPPYSTF